MPIYLQDDLIDYKRKPGLFNALRKEMAFNLFQRYVTSYTPITVNNYQTISEFGSLSTDEKKWSGGVLATNGKIYAIPSTGGTNTILVIDPVARTTTTFGTTEAGYGWGQAVLAPNGKIYGMPLNDGDPNTPTLILEVDPIAETVTTFGIPGLNESDTFLGWGHGSLAPNGKIYGIPTSSGSASILEIDPSTQATTTFSTPNGKTGWTKGALAPDGKIYAAPEAPYAGTTQSILEINPVTRTATEFGYVPDGRYTDTILATNGKLYGIPNGSGGGVLEIDPVTKTTSTFGDSIGAGASPHASAVLAPNGKIYTVPLSGVEILEIDPLTKTTALFGVGILPTGLFKWSGGVLAPNGKIYGIPRNATTVLEIGVEVATSQLLLSAYVNNA